MDARLTPGRGFVAPGVMTWRVPFADALVVAIDAGASTAACFDAGT